jgi:signal transduction histidine kinase
MRFGDATVRVTGLADHMSIEVTDDGIGGADQRTGSGLRGLSDRVAAIDGTLTIVSPIGQGNAAHGADPDRATRSDTR